MDKRSYISLVEVFLEMGKLTRESHEDWRHGRIPYLEKVIQLNLSQINAVCRAVHASARKGKLKGRWTAYVKWGKGGRPPLRFTKTGSPELERLWATHYLHPRLNGPRPETSQGGAGPGQGLADPKPSNPPAPPPSEC